MSKACPTTSGMKIALQGPQFGGWKPGPENYIVWVHAELTTSWLFDAEDVTHPPCGQFPHLLIGLITSASQHSK